MFSPRKIRGVVVSGVAVVAALTPTADTPATSVLTFTSDSTITGAVKGKRGTLIVKNAGVFTTKSDGSIVDLQTDHRRWNGQTRRGAGVCPGQRNVFGRRRREL